MATPSGESNVELARRGMRAWIAGDLEVTLGNLADDVEIYIPTELANPGTFRGHDGFLRWVKQWNEAWAEFDYELVDLAPVGESHVVAAVRTHGKGRGSGVEVEDRQGWVFGIRDGLCCFFSLQASVEDARALAEERERA